MEFTKEKTKDKISYQEFLQLKQHSVIDYGINPIDVKSEMYDFQKYVTEYAIKKGRSAVFLDTGLGKTIIELTVAENYRKQTNKPVLIITPLAVAFQFIKEAEKFGIDDIEYSKDGRYKSTIVVCNYERLHYFNPNDFECVILDESSILKNFDGATKTAITQFFRKVNYRYLFTATPSPNDYIELGTSSEALGYMGYMDMLQKYFANNDNNIRPHEIVTKWYLKPHATKDFWRWVASWSMSARKPSDLGFSDDAFILPELITNRHSVKNESNWVVNGQVMLFGKIAVSMGEVREEQKMTINNRCEKAILLASEHDRSVYWCNFNNEGDLLNELDKDAVQIKGTMDIDKKEDILLNFANGNIKKLITKPTITAFGLNWQHCNHTVYFPTWSYEQYYQAIRRFWRFGQKRSVTVDLVLSDGQKRVIDSLEMKSKKAVEMFEILIKQTHEYNYKSNNEFKKEFQLPKFFN